MRAALTIVVTSALVSSALAGERFNLFVFENADGADTSILDIWVDVIGNGATVDFVWHNDSSAAANLSEIYIESSDASDLLLNAAILNTGGVSYSSSASPGTPPGSVSLFGGAWGGSLFSADPDSPQANVNAINPGESLTTRFDLTGALTFADVIAALNGETDAFRLAAHVQGIGADAESVWLVTPTPSALSIMGLGLLVGSRRRRS